jgi:hypothetical protein
MLKEKLGISSLIILSLAVTTANAQSTVLVSGGDTVQKDGSISYSIGQISYNATDDVIGSVYEGVQQPILSTTLPLAVLNLKVTKQEKQVIISWQVASETNIRYFIVQRGDGIIFNDLRKIDVAAKSSEFKNYKNEDDDPQPGKNFYRIKQVDDDGSVSYSNIVYVIFNNKEEIGIVYPNPAHNTIILKSSNFIDRFLSYRLYDITGRLLLASQIANTLTNIDISNLSPSNYILKIIDRNKEIGSFKIIKTK